MPFGATQMDLEIVILSEVSQRKKNIIRYHLYMESFKKRSKWTYTTEIDSKTENKLMVVKGDWGDKLGVWG